LLGLASPLPAQTPAGVTARDVEFYSEAVVVKGRLFLPPGFTVTSNLPAVVLAPGQGETAATVEKYAAVMAARGLVALAFDYRGWGRSGAFIYTVEPIRWDDRLRFSQHTATVRLRRKRLIPEAQVTDIRNALTFLQGEPGVDRTRLGVWGTDLGGGHAVRVAGIDGRVKAAVAQAPLIAGEGTARTAFKPTVAQQADMVRLARDGSPAVVALAAGTAKDPETRLGLAEYRPFHVLDQIPETTAVLFVIAEKDTVVNNNTNAIAASKVVRGQTGIVAIPTATHTLTGANFEQAAAAAAAWFLKFL
jgi:dienelactone hydrolase